MEKRILTNVECKDAASRLALKCVSRSSIYGVPRGGVPVAYLVFAPCLAAHPCPDLDQDIVDDPTKADLIVDDVIDSGTTKAFYEQHFPNARFEALASYLDPPHQKGQWLVFPWERGRDGQDESATDIVTRLLQYIGEDPGREGLKETPQRVLKAWKEWTAGYGQEPAQVLKCFQDGSENYDEMVVVKGLPFYSMCEHHLAPFFGTATIAYLPSKQVVGLSKLGRLLDIFARRIQVQERLTTQVADALMLHLQPRGVGVVVKARHMCMESRGYGRQGHETVSTALRGMMLDQERVRNEFLSIAT